MLLKEEAEEERKPRSILSICIRINQSIFIFIMLLIIKIVFRHFIESQGLKEEAETEEER